MVSINAEPEPSPSIPVETGIPQRSELRDPRVREDDGLLCPEIPAPPFRGDKLRGHDNDEAFFDTLRGGEDQGEG
jgi:hypothetical protein